MVPKFVCGHAFHTASIKAHVIKCLGLLLTGKLTESIFNSRKYLPFMMLKSAAALNDRHSILLIILLPMSLRKNENNKQIGLLLSRLSPLPLSRHPAALGCYSAVLMPRQTVPKASCTIVVTLHWCRSSFTSSVILPNR